MQNCQKLSICKTKQATTKSPPYLKSTVKPSTVKQDMPVYGLKRNNGLEVELTVLSPLSVRMI